MGGCPGPPGTRPAPLGGRLHPSLGPCTCEADLTLQNFIYALRHALALEGRVTYLDRMPEAAAAYGRMPRTPRDTASTIGRSAASVARTLHV